MKQKNLSAEEQLTKVVVLVCDYLADFIRDKVPQSGHFQPFGVRFDVYGTENQGMMRVEHHTIAPKEEKKQEFLQDVRSLSQSVDNYYD